VTHATGGREPAAHIRVSVRLVLIFWRALLGAAKVPASPSPVADAKETYVATENRLAVMPISIVAIGCRLSTCKIRVVGETRIRAGIKLTAV